MVRSTKEILTFLPHRYPFLLVDRILEKGEDYIIGLKNVTVNELFFQGHFPEVPVMPGVLILEAMAQVGGILYMEIVPSAEKQIFYLAGLDKARFRKPVVPGDQLRLKVRVIRMRKGSCKFHGEAFVGDEIVAEADVLCVVEKAENQST